MEDVLSYMFSETLHDNDILFGLFPARCLCNECAPSRLANCCLLVTTDDAITPLVSCSSQTKAQAISHGRHSSHSYAEGSQCKTRYREWLTGKARARVLQLDAGLSELSHVRASHSLEDSREARATP